MLRVPILFLVFNRPDTTLKVLQSIRAQQPKRLYIASDGARAHKLGEAQLVTDLRQAVLDSIDWECEIFTFFQDTNLGCGKAVSAAIDWFFSKEEAGIIIEDDIVADDSFFPFCASLLSRYKDDPSVMHITGQNFQFGKERTSDSYYFSRYPLIWGWATWRRAWAEYRFCLDDLQPEDLVGVPPALQQAFLDVKEHKVDTWDYQWMYAIWKNRGKCIVPKVNLIHNIGFGNGATHTTSAPSWYKRLKLGKIADLKYPVVTDICDAADAYYVKHIVNNEPFPFSIQKLRQLYHKYKKRLNVSR